MNIHQPYRTSEIDFSNVVYTKTKETSKKKIILIKYMDNNKLSNLVFQTPTLFNIHEPIIGNGYGEIDVALYGKDKDKINKFSSFLHDLENKIKDDAQLNARSWFNLDASNEINFQKIIRESEQYNGVLKLKIIQNNDFETILQYNNNKKMELSMIPSSSWVKVLLEVYALWIKPNNDFGIFLRPVLAEFKKDVYSYNFVEDSEEEEDNDVPDTEFNSKIFMKLDQNKEIPKDNKSSSDKVSNTSMIDMNIMKLTSELNKDTENFIKLNLDEMESSTSELDSLENEPKSNSLNNVLENKVLENEVLDNGNLNNSNLEDDVSDNEVSDNEVSEDEVSNRSSSSDKNK